MEGLKNKVLGTSGGSSAGGGNYSNAYSTSARSAPQQASATLTSYELRQYSPALIRQLYAYYLANQQLGEGALREMRRLYDGSGRGQKGQSWETYVDTVVRASFR